MSIYEVCLEVHNFFAKESDIHKGEYTIANGAITNVGFLAENQYFRIKGSVFNDGVYKYTSEALDDLIAESFSGEIWAMSPPKAFIEMCDKMSDWENRYGGVDSAAMSPFNSESFGGYSYSKSNNAGADGSSAASSVFGVFASDLNKWRRLNRV